MEREVGGGIGMGNTCKPMADSFQCMTKPYNKKKKERKKRKKKKVKQSNESKIQGKNKRHLKSTSEGAPVYLGG